MLVKFFDHFQFTSSEFFHYCFVEENDFLLTGYIIVIDIKSGLKNAIKYLTELRRIVFFAVNDVTEGFLVFFFS